MPDPATASATLTTTPSTLPLPPGWLLLSSAESDIRVSIPVEAINHIEEIGNGSRCRVHTGMNCFVVVNGSCEDITARIAAEQERESSARLSRAADGLFGDTITGKIQQAISAVIGSITPATRAGVPTLTADEAKALATRILNEDYKPTREEFAALSQYSFAKTAAYELAMSVLDDDSEAPGLFTTKPPTPTPAPTDATTPAASTPSPDATADGPR